MPATSNAAQSTKLLGVNFMLTSNTRDSVATPRTRRAVNRGVGVEECELLTWLKVGESVAVSATDRDGSPIVTLTDIVSVEVVEGIAVWVNSLGRELQTVSFPVAPKTMSRRNKRRPRHLLGGNPMKNNDDGDKGDKK